MTDGFTVRSGGAEDAQVLTDLFDASVRWQVARGFSAQWGSTPFSEVPKRVATIRDWAAGGGLRICERDGRPAAAMVLGPAQPYVSPATEPELYIVVLVGSHEPFARGAGAYLLGVAADEARRAGVGLLRVDCFAGNGGALVAFYERRGFTKDETFMVGEWAGQVLVRRVEQRVTAASPPSS